MTGVTEGRTSQGAAVSGSVRAGRAGRAGKRVVSVSSSTCDPWSLQKNMNFATEIFRR